MRFGTFGLKVLYEFRKVFLSAGIGLRLRKTDDVQ